MEMDPEHFNPDEQPEVKYYMQIRLISLSDFKSVVELYQSNHNISPTSQFTLRPSSWDPQHEGVNAVYIVGEVVIPTVDSEHIDESESPLHPDSEVWDTSFQIFNDLWFDFDEDTQLFSTKEGTVLCFYCLNFSVAYYFHVCLQVTYLLFRVQAT
jgi:hypothetical protein